MKRLRPHCFMTFATPHIGVRRPQRSPFNIVFQSLAPLWAGQTGAELTLTDDVDTPLLLQMSKGAYIEALQMFQKKILYGNVFYDIQVPLTTSTISLHKNPYRTMESSEIVYEEGTDCVIERKKILSGIDGGIPQDFQSDGRGDLIREINRSLNEIDWMKYDVLLPFAWLDPHNRMIRHPSVIEHAISKILK